jgi:hypothetical protein
MKTLAVLGLLLPMVACSSQVHRTFGTEEKVYLDPLPRSVSRQDLDRYTCPGEQPPWCRCAGRLSAQCECSCPLGR